MKQLFLTIAFCCCFIVLFAATVMGFRLDKMINRVTVTFILSYAGSIAAAVVIAISLQGKRKSNKNMENADKSEQHENGNQAEVK